MTASTDSQAHDSLHLSIATSLPAYRPGEIITALLQVSSPLPDSIELQDMEISFSGIERVDTSWISSTYRKNIPAINTDKRRIQRHVIEARLKAATQGEFTDSSPRRFLIRFTLPTWLPPSYKGTSVRYWYFLDAKVNYSQNLNDGAPTQPIHTATARLPLLLWPEYTESTSNQQNNTNKEDTATNTRFSAKKNPPTESTLITNATALLLKQQQQQQLLNNKNSSTLKETPTAPHDIFPIISQDDFPMKCWEVGAGTAVEDAITHILEISSDMPSSSLHSTPFSPGLQQQRRLSSSLGRLIDGENELESQRSLDGGKGRLVGGVTAASTSLSSSTTASASTASMPSSFSKQLALEEEEERPSQQQMTTSGTKQMDISATGIGLKTFALRIGDIPLVRVCLHPTFSLTGGLHPGSVIAGTLEFPVDDVHALQCMHVTVMLETEERISQAWRSKSASKLNDGDGTGGVLRKVHDEQIESTKNTACTHFVFSLPHDATPSFHTELVSLKWVLKFIFVAVHEYGGVEKLVWSLPLTVSSPH